MEQTDWIARESLELCGELLEALDKLNCTGDFREQYTRLATAYMARTGKTLKGAEL